MQMSLRVKWLWIIAVTVIAVAIGLFYHYQFKTEWWEVSAFITGVVAVYLVVREDIWNWPVGVVNVTIFAWVFFTSRLYADMALQFFYVVIQFYGWWSWLHGGKGKSALTVTRLERKNWLWIVIVIAIGTAICVPIVARANGASPFWDSLLTVTSIVAQLMLNRKILENWILWILADICYIPLFLSRNLYPTALLYAIFLGLAVSGYLAWKKNCQIVTSEP